jgi:hypothetical protein
MRAIKNIIILAVAALLGWGSAGYFQASEDQPPATAKKHLGSMLGSGGGAKSPPPQLEEQLAIVRQQLSKFQDGSMSLPDALAFIYACESDELRQTAYWILAARAVDTDPEFFLEQLLELGFRNEIDLPKVFFTQWYQRDPTAAWAAMVGITRVQPYYGNPIPLAVISAQFRTDPQSTYAFIVEKIPAFMRDSFWGRIASDLAAQSVPAAIAALQKMPGEHESAIRAIAERWAITNPMAAVDWAMRAAGKTNYGVFGLGFPVNPSGPPAKPPALDALAIWMASDPEAALAAAASYQITMDGQLELSMVDRWYSNDPEEALRWAVANQERADFHLPSALK